MSSLFTIENIPSQTVKLLSLLLTLGLETQMILSAALKYFVVRNKEIHVFYEADVHLFQR